MSDHGAQSPIRLPLHLCQVLEEEYVALHGQPTTGRQGWRILATDVAPGAAESLLRKLTDLQTAPALPGGPQSPDVFSIHLLKRLEEKLGDGLRDTLRGGGASERVSAEERLASLLDSVLDDDALYDPDIARRLPPPRAHEGLLVARDQTGELEKTDLERFNRVLLEDAYPGTLKDIYQARLEAVISDIHTQPRAALCLSGGGIRSGTFSLGILQGLARCKLLSYFHYLSTVSGGGYVGSWFTTWCYRHRDGFRGVERDLARASPTSKLEPEPPPLRHLREYSNFVAPQPSLISADVWSFAAIYVRNLIINWSVLIPLLLAFVLLPRVMLAVLYMPVLHHGPSHPTLAIVIKGLLLCAGLLFSVIAVLYITLNRPSRADALASCPFLVNRRSQGAFLWWSLLPTVLAGVCLTVFWGSFRDTHLTQKISFWEGMNVVGLTLPFGLLLIGLGIALYGGALLTACALLRRSPKLGDVLAALITGSVGGVLTWLVLYTVFTNPTPDRSGLPLMPALYVLSAVPVYLLIFFVSATAFVAATSRRAASRTRQWFSIEDEDREWLGRHAAWLLIAAVGWLVFSALALFGPVFLVETPRLLSGIGGLAGIIALIGGRSAKTPGASDPATKPGWKELLVEHGLSIAAIVFIALLVAVLSWAGSWLLSWIIATWFDGLRPDALLEWQRVGPEAAQALWDPETQRWIVRKLWTVTTPNGQLAILYHVPWWLAGPVTLALGVIAYLLARFVVNLNKFSLHAAYRARIIRGFLGGSRPADDREPNPFTGFDPQDNVQMHELRPGLLNEASFKTDGLARLAARLRDSQQTSTGTESLLSRYVAARDARQRGDGEIVNVPYAAVYQHLSGTTKMLLGYHQGLNPPSQSLKRALIEDLNRLIETDLLEIEPFKRLPVSDRVGALLVRLCAPGLPGPLPTRADSIEAWLPDHGRGQSAILVRRAILDETLEEVEPLGPPPPPWATYRLMHIIGTALNLVGGKRLAWQQRRAESFTISPLHCGSLFTGYRPARHYGGPDGISLGTAVTISGAAVSSNMGYHSSSAAVTFVLTLFNARLGWWLGNPGPAGMQTYTEAYPRSSITPLRLEAFGLTDDSSPYVLLSDGGHFDNLGLYEMVLRRCRVIVVADGGQDGAAVFDDLGSAIRKIRIDLGIDIEFDDPMRIYPRRRNLHDEAPANQRDGTYFAIGRIGYAAVDTVTTRPGNTVAAPDGVLIYVKPAIYGEEPRDVVNYAAANPDFPHQSTLDQLFDEAQFESYRRLGLWVIQQICLGPVGAPNSSRHPLGDFIDGVHVHMQAKSRPPGSASLPEWLKAIQRELAPKEAGVAR